MELGYNCSSVHSNIYVLFASIISRFMGQIQLMAFISKRPTSPKMFVFLYYCPLSWLLVIHDYIYTEWLPLTSLFLSQEHARMREA